MVAHGALADARRPCGTPLSMPMAHALIELIQSDEAMTVSMLADRLAIDRTNVSRLCMRMEDAGELTRRAHPRDGRARSLHLTPRGEALARRVDASSTRHFTRLAQTLGGSTGDVIESLQRLEKAMTLPDDEEQTQ